MHKTVEEIIAESRQKESEELARLEEAIGFFYDALRGFIDISVEWKIATDAVAHIDFDDVRTDLFTARAVSLSVLTARILERAREMPKALMSGGVMSAVGVWRYVSEAKNIAMAIDLDELGPTGFQWLNHSIIDQAKVDVAKENSARFAEQAKQILAEAGFPYDKDNQAPWNEGIDEKKYKNAVARSGYVWKMRNFPPEVTKEDRAYLTEGEQEMIRLANSFAHPSLTPGEKLKDCLRPMILTTIIDLMAVMLAYKVAASAVAGWPTTKTVGEQFHVYPADADQAKALSFMVKEMSDYCLNVFREKLMGED